LFISKYITLETFLTKKHNAAVQKSEQHNYYGEEFKFVKGRLV